jgi:hypothetical protein
MLRAWYRSTPLIPNQSNRHLRLGFEPVAGAVVRAAARVSAAVAGSRSAAVDGGLLLWILKASNLRFVPVVPRSLIC